MSLETFCHICGVNFAIARHRRFNEPQDAAWDVSGSGYIVNDDGNMMMGGIVSCGKQCQTRDMKEHITGRDCRSTEGYSGHRISVEEMKGCRDIQALVKKESDWTPEPDDQDFEFESDYFLTGISDRTLASRSLLIDIKPIRHGCERQFISNDENDGGNHALPVSLCLMAELTSSGVPIHPTCFEIFKKVSLIRLGHVDVESLFRWRPVGTSIFCHGSF